MNQRYKSATVEEFKNLLQAKAIRPASLEDVHGTHHERGLYQHPNTGQWYVEVAQTRAITPHRNHRPVIRGI